MIWVLLSVSCAAPQPGPWSEVLAPVKEGAVRGIGEVSVRSTPLHVGILSSAGFATDGSSLRFEARSPLGVTQLIVLISKGQWSIHIPDTGLHLLARDANETLLSLTDGVVSLSSLQQLLLGQLGWVPGSILDQIRAVDNPQPVVIPFSTGPALRLALDPSQQFLGKFSVLNTHREALLEVSYSDFRDGRAHQFQVMIPRVQMTFSFSFQQLSAFSPTEETFQISGQDRFQTVAMEQMWPVILERLLQNSDP